MLSDMEPGIRDGKSTGMWVSASSGRLSPYHYPAELRPVHSGLSTAASQASASVQAADKGPPTHLRGPFSLD